jgi:hypothetical protein
MKNTPRFAEIIQKVRDNKKTIKGLIRLKKKIERGEFLELAVMAMLEREHKNYQESSTLAKMEAIGGIQ